MVRFREHTHPPSLETEDDRIRFRVLRRLLGDIQLGRVNWTGEFTVASGTTTTRIEDDNIRSSSLVAFTPMEINAASLVGAGIWVSAQVESSILSGVAVGYFDLAHAAPAADCTFRYAIIG